MITISFNDILNSIKALASFEAGRGVQDESLYNTIMVSDADKPFLLLHAQQAQSAIASAMLFCLPEYDVRETSGDTLFVYSFGSDCALNETSPTKRLLSEAMSLYIMSRWLGNKIPERAETYVSMYGNIVEVLVKSANRSNPKIHI